MALHIQERQPKIRGIGVEGVASEIGALGRYAKTFTVRREDLVRSLIRRYRATRVDAEAAIHKASEAGVVVDVDGLISLIAE